jgi:hypothetical protein
MFKFMQLEYGYIIIIILLSLLLFNDVLHNTLQIHAFSMNRYVEKSIQVMLLIRKGFWELIHTTCDYLG